MHPPFGALPAPAAAHDEVTPATLDNGLQVVIVRDPLAPVVTEITTYKAGSDQAPAAYPETAHAVEHMVAGRSLKNLSENQPANIWTLLGANADAQTRETATNYYFTIPSELLDVALHVEAERMSGALFLAERVDRRAPGDRQRTSRLFLEHDPPRVYTKALNALYPGRFDDSKHLPGLAKTTPDMLRAFYMKVVHAEQRAAGDLGRRRSRRDAGAGASHLRRHSQADGRREEPRRPLGR